MSVTLEKDQRARAWSLAYLASVDELPSSEIVLEARLTAAVGLFEAAHIAEEVASERRATGMTDRSDATLAGLGTLWGRVNQEQVRRLVVEEGYSLISAMRLVWALDHAGEDGAR